MDEQTTVDNGGHAAALPSDAEYFSAMGLDAGTDGATTTASQPDDKEGEAGAEATATGAAKEEAPAESEEAAEEEGEDLDPDELTLDYELDPSVTTIEEARKRFAEQGKGVKKQFDRMAAKVKESETFVTFGNALFDEKTGPVALVQFVSQMMGHHKLDYATITGRLEAQLKAEGKTVEVKAPEPELTPAELEAMTPSELVAHITKQAEKASAARIEALERQLADQNKTKELSVAEQAHERTMSETATRVKAAIKAEESGFEVTDEMIATTRAAYPDLKPEQLKTAVKLTAQKAILAHHKANLTRELPRATEIPTEEKPAAKPSEKKPGSQPSVDDYMAAMNFTPKR